MHASEFAQSHLCPTQLLTEQSCVEPLQCWNVYKHVPLELKPVLLDKRLAIHHYPQKVLELNVT